MRLPSIALAVLVTASTAGLAAAAPLGDALARHAVADVTALRAMLPDGGAAIRCTLGAVYARRNDLPRAMIYLADCDDAELPEEIAIDVLRATRESRKRARDELASLEIISNPPGMIVEIDALPGEKLTAPITVWVKAGTHTVRATGDGTALQSTVTAQGNKRTPVVLDAGTRIAPPPKNGTVDFTEDNATEQTVTPPPDIKHPSLIKGKYRGIAESGGEQLEDPLALRVERSPRPWFGLRIGGGMFDDGASPPAFRPSIAATGRFSLSGSRWSEPADAGERGQWFLAARIDWSRRGGAADTAIDSIGASAGVGVTVVTRGSLALAVLGQLRGDLRFSDVRQRAQQMMPVRRGGATAAVGGEVSARGTPLTVGIRFEQGLSELVKGSRDRALLLELGVDWR